LLVPLFILDAPGNLFGQSPPKGPAWDGYESFANLIHLAKLEPIKKPEYLPLIAPDEIVIFVLGDLKVLDDIEAQIGDLGRFLYLGGAFLIASSQPDHGRLKRWKLQLDGRTVNQKKSTSYQGLWQECPLITPGLGQQVSHPLVKGFRKGLATHEPSFLRPDMTNLTMLAGFHPDCFLLPAKDHGLWQQLLAPQKPRPEGGFLWALEDIPSSTGRALFLASPSVFWNKLMLFEANDNDNFEFARRCADWIRQGPDNPRSLALVVADGKILTFFNLPLEVPYRLPHPETIVNNILHGIQKEKTLDNFLINEVGKDRFMQGWLWALTASLGLIWAWRLMHRRHKLEKHAPLYAGRFESSHPPPLEDPRFQAAVESGNLWEPAQVLVRQWFQERSSQPCPWDEEHIAPPQVLAEGSWWQRRRLQRKVERLWRWAAAPPAPLSLRRFCKLMAELDGLTQAVNQETVRFVA
jgi:hypothetical protein